VIYAFRQAFPAVHLNLEEMSSKEVADSLVDGSIDIGLMRPLPLPDSLVSVELFREPLVAVLNSAHPLVPDSSSGLHLADMANEPFVFFPRGYGSGLYSQLQNLARAAGFSPHIAQEAGAAMTIIGLVSAGLGVSVLPASFQWMRIDGVVYRPLLDPGAESAVWLVQRRETPSAMVKGFVELLRGAG
jgi:DNA-binding transcriptional LysR family regulator